MSLWILNNAFAAGVAMDLKRICPDRGLSIDIGQTQDPSGLTKLGSGRVTYTPTQSSAGCDIVAFLVSHAGYVGMRGEGADWSTRPVAGNTLLDQGGVTVFDKYPSTTTIEIVYDFSDCNGRGTFVHDAGGAEIPMPRHVTLYHELAHARRMLLGTLDPTKTDQGGIEDENVYRDSIGLPRRSGHTGGCVTAAAPMTTKSNGCFIATAAYGSPLEPEVEFLRRFRDEVLLQTRPGQAFFDRYWKHYSRFGPPIAELMRQDSQVKEIVRWALVTPIIHYLQTIQRFPDEPIDGLDEPWRSFLIEMRDELEEWAQSIELPYHFRGISAYAAAREIEIVLRYILRRRETRSAYLSYLEELGQLPLDVKGDEREEIFEQLRSFGRSEEEIEQILGPAAHQAQRDMPSFQEFGARGPNHVLSQQQFRSEEWFYTVVFQNATPDVWNEVWVFYKRPDIQGITFLVEHNVLPGENRVFRMGPCNKMESYTFLVYVEAEGTEYEIAFPPVGEGVLTPARVSQIDPSDTEPCEDSWIIESSG